LASRDEYARPVEAEVRPVPGETGPMDDPQRGVGRNGPAAPQKPEDDVFERAPRRRSPLSSTARSETQRVLRAVRGASWSESSDPRRGFETGAEPRGSGTDPTFALSPLRS
jgi:hypothetical protein